MLLPLACLKRYFLKVLQSLGEFVEHYQSLKVGPSLMKVFLRVTSIQIQQSLSYPNFNPITKSNLDYLKKDSKQFLFVKYLVKFWLSISFQGKRMTIDQLALWQYRLWSFKSGNTKSVMFQPKNECVESILQYSCKKITKT